MGLRDDVKARLPALLLHEGVWEGTYQTVDLKGDVVDRHRSRVECLFPDDGPYAYFQKNVFTWKDGKETVVEFGGELREDKIYWDTERFSGYGWTTFGDVVMLQLERKDEPGSSFIEVIALGASGTDRLRTWHWFRDGIPYQRTLCNERLIR